jgi:transposase InsO family protein
VDLTGKVDSSGNLHPILGVIDHGTRLNLCTSVLNNKRSTTILGSLVDLMNHYGKPDTIRTDNELVFNSRLFKTGLQLMGIRHQTIHLAQPWQNGRIERYFGTLKSKLDQWQVDSSLQLNRSLKQFRFWYNHVRPHQHLNGKTPAEAWQGKDLFLNGYKKSYWFDAWDGLLTGYYLN